MSEPENSSIILDDSCCPGPSVSHISDSFRNHRARLQIPSSGSESSSDDEENHRVEETDESGEEPLPQSGLSFNDAIASTPVRQNKSVVDISSDSSDEGPSVLIRIGQLKTETRKLEILMSESESEIQSLLNTLRTIDPRKLPDGGSKLKNRIEERKKELARLQDTKNRVTRQLRDLIQAHAPGGDQVKPKNEMLSQKTPSRQVVVPTTQPTVTTNMLVPAPSLNPALMGKKALERYQSEQMMTVNALENLHVNLKQCPKENECADDPSGLKVELLPHQKTALAWMIWRESKKPYGGILADDMGLGKTLTMIALVLKIKQLSRDSDESSDEELSNEELGLKKLPRGGTLVVCPTSVMSQWEGEVKKRVRGGTLSLYAYHGTNRETRPRTLARYDLVITTYPIIQREVKGTALMGVYWERVVLDEAHIIRNHKTQTAAGAFALAGKNKWALTGTPIHNKTMDFFSLVKFIRVKPFDDLKVWKHWVDNKDAAGAKRLDTLNKTLMLRRTKEGIIKAGGLKALKTKNHKLVPVKLDRDEFELYKAIAQFSSTVMAQFLHLQAEKRNLLDRGVPPSGGRQFASMVDPNIFKDFPELARMFDVMKNGNVKSHEILTLLLRLRQVCVHPHLARAFIEKSELGAVDGEPEDGLAEEMGALSLGEKNANTLPISSENPIFKRDRCSSKLRAVIECLTEISSTSDDKIIIVSQWTSVLEIIHEYLNDMNIPVLELTGKVKVKDRGPVVEEFNSPSLNKKVLLLSLTAGGTGLTLTGGNHLLLVDIHWNPQLEAQAFDRIYRVGQGKDVHIYKFLCEDTIEERILKLQETKLELAHNVLTGTSKVVSDKLTMNDLKMLFNIPN